MPSLTARLRSLLCAGLFLAGAFGLPLTDAALFHRAGHDPYAGVIHVEQHGGAHHGDRCTLAQPVPPQLTGLPSTDIIQAAPPVECRTALAPAPEPRSADSPTTQRTRAPPA